MLENDNLIKSFPHRRNLLPDFIVKSYRASCSIQKEEEVQAIEKMFTDKTFLSSLELSEYDTEAIKINAIPLSCSVLNMNFFDKLIDAGMISDTGYVLGCYEEEIDGILVQDKLRLMCAKDNNGEHNLPLCHRREFIFHLLKLLSIGGSRCQCEDNFYGPLSNSIKVLYKELIQVKKTESGKIETCSSVYELNLQTNIDKLYPYPNNVHNKCYVIISEQKVILLLKKFMPFW